MWFNGKGVNLDKGFTFSNKQLNYIMAIEVPHEDILAGRTPRFEFFESQKTDEGHLMADLIVSATRGDLSALPPIEDPE